jgi:hypothetical protein
MTTTFPSERTEGSILLLRGHKILLDVHLAALYGVTTKRLNEQVKRNRSRFPADFMFQLTTGEVASLRSQPATSNRGRGGRRYRPYAFTEQGVAMLSTVLNGARVYHRNLQVTGQENFVTTGLGRPLAVRSRDHRRSCENFFNSLFNPHGTCDP